MEVRQGYKQTEVGVIPQDWSEAPLSSLIEKGSRITYGVVKPGRNDINGVLFVRGGDILAGRINETQLRRIPKAVSEQYKRTRLSGGEILISLVGYPGEAALVPRHLGGANIARQVALVRLNKDLPINPEFVCKFLQSDVGRRQLLREAIGSAQQVINLRDIHKVAVAFPPTELEQSAIAAALSDVAALLDGLDRLIAKKRELRLAAMQQLLTGQTRLPGFHGEWEIKRLGEVGTFLKGSGVRKHETRSGDLPCIRYGEIYTHHSDYVRSFNSWISRAVADTATPLRRGDGAAFCLHWIKILDARTGF
jgi:type I restriction enzyme S subunit